MSKQFRDVVADLKKNHPPLVPVRVYLRKIAPVHDCVGYTMLKRDRNNRPMHFLIVVDSGHKWTIVKDTLIHEWAHAMTWSEHETAEDHGPEWGLAYARLYREFIG